MKHESHLSLVQVSFIVQPLLCGAPRHNELITAPSGHSGFFFPRRPQGAATSPFQT